MRCCLVRNKHSELSHIQKLPLEDPSPIPFIPRPWTWFCICISVFLPQIASAKLETSLAAWMQMVFRLGGVLKVVLMEMTEKLQQA